MAKPDLNQLITLQVLLAEGSVARAARRLHLSPSAMSRALARLRVTLGDPLLVRAGRGLVPTPRALALRDRVEPLVAEARQVLKPAQDVDLGSLARTFTLRTRDGFVESFGPALLARVRAAAPGVRVHFTPKGDRDPGPLQDGRVDLETGVVGEDTHPELKSLELFRDRFIGVVGPDHPLARGRVTAARFAAGRHLGITRRGQERGRVDEALAPLGLSRDVAVRVDGFSAALALVRQTDLIAVVPERHTGALREGLHAFELPVSLPEITVSLLWHPRMHADPAHQWLRACVREVCGAGAPRRRRP